MSSADGGERIVPLTLGLVSDPPTLMLVYEILQTKGQGEIRKRRKRKMPLRNFSDKSDIRKFIFILQQRHAKFLSSVPQVFLEKVLRIIQRVQGGLRIGEAVNAVDEEFRVNGDEDLNKIQPEELQRKKELMNETFHKHLILPGDPGYIYDKEIEFKPAERGGSAWDEEDDEPDLGPKSVGETSASQVPPLQKPGSDRHGLGLDEEDVERAGGLAKHSRDISTNLKSIFEEIVDESIGTDEVDRDKGAQAAGREDFGGVIPKEGGTSRDEASLRKPATHAEGNAVENPKDAAEPAIMTEGEDSPESVGSEDFESEGEESDQSVQKELSKEYDFKLVEDAEVDETEEDDFWKF